MPLAYLLFVALPLSIWQSPGADRRAVAMLAGSLALLFLIASTGRATLTWARIYFATGVVIVLFRDRFADNELAGIMLLFLPLAVVLAGSRALPRSRRLQAGLLTLLFAGTLLATGSRGGLLAMLATGGLVLIAERRWRLLLLGLVITGAWAASGPIDWLIYDGKVQGLTLDSLLTGRPEIWRRSMHAVADFSWTGIGIGSFPAIVPALYYPPGTRPLEDAHSLPIQTALDLGVFGLLAMTAIVWLAFSRAYSARRRLGAAPERRAWALGLFASLSAFVLFNLADAVAPGSPGSLPFFLLLGLIYALPKSRPRKRRRWRIPVRGRRRLLIGALFMLLGLSSIRGARQLNRAAVLGARAITQDPSLLPAAQTALDAATGHNCRAGWLAGKVAQARDRPGQRDDAWADLLRCSDAFVPLVADELPGDRRLAEQAVQVQPSSAAAHFWLARIRVAERDHDDAERLYRRGLELAPGHGLAWLELGRLLAPEDRQAALAAFIKSCHRGDPGANACLAAGITAERLGDVELALRYYRKSRLHRARERVEQLLAPEKVEDF